MRILLPPSESKTAGGRGRPLSRRADPGPLAAPRAVVIEALQRLLAGDPARAAAALLLPSGVAAAALGQNERVAESATTPALRRYAGVVYDGLGYQQLSVPEQRVAARSTLIFSGLFGVLRGAEPVPQYRVPAKAVLPGIGVAGTFWRPILDSVLPALVARQLIVDLRSGDYAAMWRPPRALAHRVVSVRVLSPRPGGGTGILSYPSKFAKGRLAAALVRRVAGGGAVASIEDVAEAWTSLGGHGHGYQIRGPGSLDLHTC